MMIARVPPSALSHLRPGLRLAGPTRPVTRLQERRAAGAAARGCRAARRCRAATAELGRPTTRDAGDVLRGFPLSQSPCTCATEEQALLRKCCRVSPAHDMLI